MRPTLGILSLTIQRSLREYTVNDHTFHMVQVQKGRFWMGNDNSEYDYEKPAHWVDIAQDFELGQYFVTQALWEAVMGENPSHFQGADRPVENVSWDDIMGTEVGVKSGKARAGFLDRLNTLITPEDGYRFALPSEAQWEYAARGGRYGAAFPYAYAGSNYLPEVGWYDDSSQRETQAIGRKQPNVLGLYDMSGNVWEWCEDEWQNNYKGAPEDGSAWTKGENVGIRVVRGGSWLDLDNDCRVADRSGDDAYGWSFDVGFRLSRYRITL